MNVEPFVRVAELGGFTAAARRLGVTPAAVSKAVARLEEQLGVRLLERTSRSVTLTPEGEVWLEHARRALDTLQAGRQRLAETGAMPRGEVRVTASPVLGGVLGVALSGLVERYPDLQLSVLFSDRLESLAAADIDIAVRLGSPADSALIGTRVGATRRVTVATPGYLAAAPPLDSPADLGRHRAVRFLGPDGRVVSWSFASGADVAPANLALADGNAVVAATLAGVGVCQAIGFMVREHVASGRLTRVLADEETDGPPVYVLRRSSARGIPRVAVVVDRLLEELPRLLHPGAAGQARLGRPESA
ncbi:MAG: LysR family transcriptional regulator [Alphaproteobacteria bacterium]|nr:LysR family transcriptional regulator [Alphaproteobacteria bacterium]MCB9692649.1 LysR family transcriptional regulator [Alphaproteobacteria bacterium]